MEWIGRKWNKWFGEKNTTENNTNKFKQLNEKYEKVKNVKYSNDINKIDYDSNYKPLETTLYFTRYCQMLWIEVWIGKGLSDFLQHTIFKFHVLGHKVKLFKAFQSSPTFFCLPTEFKSHGFCGLCRSVALC